MSFINCLLLLFCTYFNTSSVLAQTTSDSVIETYDSSSGFNVVENDYNLGSFTMSNGILNLHYQPYINYGAIILKKSYNFDLSQPTWFHFRTKMDKYLIGQDMYTQIFIYSLKYQKKLQLTIGINSEGHWKSVWFLPGSLPPCTAKSADDEFFISFSPEVFPEAADTPVQYPEFHTKNYTNWVKFSMLYEPPLQGETKGLITIYVDGIKIDPLRDLSRIGSPIVDTHTDAFNGMGMTTIEVQNTLLVDGWEYSYTGNKYGMRGKGCYASLAPAVPAPLRFPPKFANIDGLIYKTVWMNKFDAVARLITDQIRTTHPEIPVFQTPRSAYTALPTGLIYPTHLRTFYWYLPLYYYNDPYLYAASQNVFWNGIYNGTIDFETAVYMGAIPLPPADHIQWNYVPPGTRDSMVARLASLEANKGSKPLAKQYAIDQIFALGNAPDVIHFGYISPEDYWNSTLPQYSSDEDKNTIPLISYPDAGLIQWDYFVINRSPDIIFTSPTPVPSASPSFTISDLKNLIINWLTPQDSNYPSPNAKVNMLDAAWVIKWLAN